MDGFSRASSEQKPTKVYIGINWWSDRTLYQKVLSFIYRLLKILHASAWFYFIPIAPVILSFSLPYHLQQRGNECLKD